MKLLYGGCAAIVVIAGLVYWLFFAAFSANSQAAYVYIDGDDTTDSVYVKLKAGNEPRQMLGLKTCALLLDYKGHLHPGRYATGNGISTLQLFRNLRGGRQSAVSLVIPVVHTMNDLAERLSQVLEADSTQWVATFRDTALLTQLDVDTATVPCLFIPNTYEVYWDVAPTKFLQRMKREHDDFWTPARRNQAKAAGLTPDEVYTLASIVEQETANEGERPQVAGMYINRLRKGIKLQADPTVKFALGNFTLRRIMHGHLSVDSPYNTYKYAGLPAGPICIPSLNAIRSVLNFARHDYLYMCAKEDFSGTHNFAATYEEHLANAKKYTEALNARGIK